MTVEDYRNKMDALVKTAKDLTMETSLSKYVLLKIRGILPNLSSCDAVRNCTTLLMQVVELSSTKWLSAAAPLKSAQEPSPNLGKKISDSSSGLNTNATPFVPSEPFETVYDMPVLQQPVSCACESIACM